MATAASDCELPVSIEGLDRLLEGVNVTRGRGSILLECLYSHLTESQRKAGLHDKCGVVNYCLAYRMRLSGISAVLRPCVCITTTSLLFRLLAIAPGTACRPRPGDVAPSPRNSSSVGWYDAALHHVPDSGGEEYRVHAPGDLERTVQRSKRLITIRDVRDMRPFDGLPLSVIVMDHTLEECGCDCPAKHLELLWWIDPTSALLCATAAEKTFFALALPGIPTDSLPIL